MGTYGGTEKASKSPDQWRSVADSTNDGVVDGIDFGIMGLLWHSDRFESPADLDRNGTIDFGDIMIFAEQWLWSWSE